MRAFYSLVAGFDLLLSFFPSKNWHVSKLQLSFVFLQIKKLEARLHKSSCTDGEGRERTDRERWRKDSCSTCECRVGVHWCAVGRTHPTPPGTQPDPVSVSLCFSQMMGCLSYFKAPSASCTFLGPVHILLPRFCLSFLFCFQLTVTSHTCNTSLSW